MKQLPNLDEKNKEKPLCYSYSVKARALLHAHFVRLPLTQETLVHDQKYILKKVPALINEMISISSQLVASAMARQRPHEMPRLETIENCMKLSPMVIQSLDSRALPLMQLPHIRPDMLRHFVNRKRNIQHIKELVSMKDGDRRDLLRSLNEVEYQNVMNVCASYPNVKMEVRSEVLDDEDSAVTAGSIVTVTVNLKRRSIMEGQDFSPLLSIDEGEMLNTGEEETEEGEVLDAETNHEAAAREPKPKSWQKQNKGKKKRGKKKQKQQQQQQQSKKPVQNIRAKGDTPEQEPVQNEGEDNGADDLVTESEDEEEAKVEEQPQPSTTRRRKRNESEASNDDDWDKYQEENKKETTLETKKRESHVVHCPFFPDEKQEAWWLYVADRKNCMLISAPVTIYTLKITEEVQLKFSAPDRIGVYTYSVILRSDSYHTDFDQVKNIKLDVKAAKLVEDHPQWDISDDEDEQALHDDEQEESDSENDSDYNTDD